MSVSPAFTFDTAPAQPTLRADVVHLWRLDLVAAASSRAWEELLSPAETARASRFHFEHDRRRFITGRGLLRWLLARYVGTEQPEALPLGTGPYGKPCLLAPYAEWQFNLSHSGDMMLLALALQRAVGVDVERMRDDLPFATLAAEIPASPGEVVSWPADEDRPLRFYRAWTGAEAQLKAAGTGFAAHPDLGSERWSLLSLLPAPGYAATLAVAGGEPFQLQCWSWPN